MLHSIRPLWMVAVAGMVAGACGQPTDSAGTARPGAAGSGSPAQRADPAGSVFCGGVNACTAKSECKTKKHDCAGKNECKGQGILSMSAKECADKGGRVEPSMM